MSFNVGDKVKYKEEFFSGWSCIDLAIKNKVYEILQLVPPFVIMKGEHHQFNPLNFELVEAAKAPTEKVHIKMYLWHWESSPTSFNATQHKPPVSASGIRAVIDCEQEVTFEVPFNRCKHCGAPQ